MTHGYLSVTGQDREEMLAAVGVASMEELFAQIPAGVRFDRALDIPPALTESELVRHMEELAAKNAHTGVELSFLGAGIYDHYVPADRAAPDTELVLDVRGRSRRARLVTKPIYRKEHA